MGDLGLTVDYYYSLTYRQFINTLRGARKKDDLKSKERLLLVRKLMYASLMPHLKKGTAENEIMSFDWENEALEKQAQKTREEFEADIDKMTAFWDRIDKARGKISEC